MSDILHGSLPSEKNHGISRQDVELIIKSALVFDGSCHLPTHADVAISQGKIIHVGCCQQFNATEYVNAEGLGLAPGFIDVHTHDDLAVIRDPQMQCKLSQGVTTVIVGNCGISASPANLTANNHSLPDPINLLGESSEFIYPSFADYAHAVEQAQPAINVAALIGHTTLRWQVLPDLGCTATPNQADQMRHTLNQALEQGAIGISTGLAYHNAQAASTNEVKQVCQDLHHYQGVYATHLRTEFAQILDAMTEAFDIGKSAKSPVIVSHLKCAGEQNWGRAPEILNHLHQAQQHQSIACDCYPYSASSSTLDLNQVTDAFEIFITWSETYPDLAGQTLADIAKHWQLPLIETAKRLQPAGAVYHCMNETDVQHILSNPSTMIGSDGLPCDPHPHPRLWGTFPRVIGHYAREQKLFSQSEAIHKMTELAAKQFSLPLRGQIKAGYWADLVLFSPETINAAATYQQPKQAAIGIDKVWVNGELSYQRDEPQQVSHGGQFIRRSINTQNDAVHAAK